VSPSDDEFRERLLNLEREFAELRTELNGLRVDLGARRARVTASSVLVVAGPIFGILSLLVSAGIAIYVGILGGAATKTPVSAPIVVRGGSVGMYSRSCWASTADNHYQTPLNYSSQYVYLGNVATDADKTSQFLVLPLDSSTWKVQLTFVDNQHSITFSSPGRIFLDADGGDDSTWTPTNPDDFNRTYPSGGPWDPTSGTEKCGQLMLAYHATSCNGIQAPGDNGCNHISQITVTTQGAIQTYSCPGGYCWVGFGQSASKISVGNCGNKKSQNLCIEP